jgi:ribonuclease D
LYIDTQAELDKFIARCSQSAFLTIDTEFLREKTYYPKLCLIQIATEEAKAIIDPLADIDIRSLAPLLADPHITKVFHAGDQDRAILYNDLGIIVRPIFDTQRAVMLLGLPQQLSLSGLVKHFCGVNLKKGESFSDWSQRPLTEKQLSYALDDVHYLPQIYLKILDELSAAGRLAWFEEDLRALEESECYTQDIYDAWKKLKGTNGLKGKQLAVVREVSAWRETAAQKHDIPRKWILSDEFVVEVAKKSPTSVDELYEIRGTKERLNTRFAQEVVASVAKGKKVPESEWPQREHHVINGLGSAPMIDMLSALLHYRSHQLQIASTFLTNHDELVRLASGQRHNLGILKGWRRELLGEELLLLLDGKLSLSVSGKEIKVTKL